MHQKEFWSIQDTILNLLFGALSLLSLYFYLNARQVFLWEVEILYIQVELVSTVVFSTVIFRPSSTCQQEKIGRGLQVVFQNLGKICILDFPESWNQITVIRFGLGFCQLMACQTAAVSEQEAGEHCGAISESVPLSSLQPQRILRLCNSRLTQDIKMFLPVVMMPFSCWP